MVLAMAAESDEFIWDDEMQDMWNSFMTYMRAKGMCKGWGQGGKGKSAAAPPPRGSVSSALPAHLMPPPPVPTPLAPGVLSQQRGGEAVAAVAIASTPPAEVEVNEVKQAAKIEGSGVAARDPKGQKVPEPEQPPKQKHPLPKAPGPPPNPPPGEAEQPTPSTSAVPATAKLLEVRSKSRPVQPRGLHMFNVVTLILNMVKTIKQNH